jgi:uncharacterized protein (TIGR00369 family)
MSREGLFWDEAEGRVPPPPAARHLGRKVIEVDPAAGTIVVEFIGRPEFLNSGGSIQGGFLAAMLDGTLALALLATLDGGQFAPTLELKVSFIRPATPGQLIGRGRIVHRGRSIAFLEGTLCNPEGDLVATATATARIVAHGGPGKEP